MDFLIILVWLLTACQKFQKYVFVIKLCVWFRFDMIFVRSPSNEYSDTNFLDFLSRCIHKVLIKMPWSKLDWNFIDLFRLWVSNSWPRHLVLLMHLLRKSRKPLQAVFHLDGLLRKSVECWKDVPVSQARYGVTGKLIMPAYKSLPVTPYQLCIVTSFQHSTDFLRSPSNERQLVTAFVTFLADAWAKSNAVVNCLRLITERGLWSFSWVLTTAFL